MESKILMRPPEFFKHVQYMRDNGPNDFHFDVRMRRVVTDAIKHFEYDYTNCAACADVESHVVDQLVSLHYIAHNAWVKKGKSSVQLTCHVIFANGESLSSEEAIGGLGDVAPRYLKQRIEKVRNAKLWALRNRVVGTRSYLHSQD